MPLAVIKDSIEYCLNNKLSFVILLLIFISLEFLADILNYGMANLGSIIFFIVIMGYGLQVIEDTIHGGNRLPKANLKKTIIYGVKGTALGFFYYFIQVYLFYLIALNLNFPIFDLEDFFLDFYNTVILFSNHDFGKFIIFVTLGFIISYVIIFFMELSIARLADGGKLRESFNFFRIKRAIGIIGWDTYAIEYSKIIAVIIFFSYIERLVDPYFGLNIFVGSAALFLAFLAEFRGMGRVYKLYTDKKDAA